VRLSFLPLVLTAACGFKTAAGVGMQIDAATDGSDPVDAPADGSIDGPPIDGSQPAMCTSSGTMDTFQSNTPCNPWASFDSTNGAQTTQSGGKLRIAAPTVGTASSHGGCFALALSTFGPEGVFIAVESALTGSSSYTALTAYTAAGQAASIAVLGGVLLVSAPGSPAVAQKVYVPAQMKWWRLRPVAGGVIGEVSPDALTWTAVGTVPGVPPTQIKIDISAGTNAVEAAAGIAIFDNLSTCP
jgi:hypothetical protein